MLKVFQAASNINNLQLSLPKIQNRFDFCKFFSAQTVVARFPDSFRVRNSKRFELFGTTKFKISFQKTAKIKTIRNWRMHFDRKSSQIASGLANFIKIDNLLAKVVKFFRLLILFTIVAKTSLILSYLIHLLRCFGGSWISPQPTPRGLRHSILGKRNRREAKEGKAEREVRKG